MKAVTVAVLTLASLHGADLSSEKLAGILDRVWVSGQVNFVSQFHGSFPSPYSGTNSFDASGDVETSRVMTLYSGLRISNSTDLLFNLEATSGGDLNRSHGLAGFTNVGLAGVPNDRPYVARAILHHSFSLGGQSVPASRGPLQMADRVTSRRLELYVGKMSLLDFFDVNAVGSDSHFQFLNWTVDNNATYGYPADTRGYTYGLLCEYHDGPWAARFAEALTPKLDNPDHLDADLVRSRSENVELELHHNLLPARIGLIRALAFVNHGALGNYRNAIDAYLSGTDATPDVVAHRAPGNRKYGFGANFEQELNSLARVFGRFGWAEGHQESLAFTEANQSLSGGFDFQGKLWRRDGDKFGVAAVTNALSGDHRRYLALGGLGSVLGDGRLTYGRETIMESYYTFRISRWVYAAVDVQRIWNPGYNRDRGPVLVTSVRLHLEGTLFDNPR